MSNKKKSKKVVMPKEVYVFVGYYEKRYGGPGNPVFAATTSLDDIPEEQKGNVIGVYSLKSVSTLSVKRKLA